MKGRRPDTSRLRVIPKKLFPDDIDVGNIVIHEDSKGTFAIYSILDNLVIVDDYTENRGDPVFQSDKKYEIAGVQVVSESGESRKI